MGTRFLAYLINLVLGIVEIILSLRLILKFLGANSGAPFVRWLYATSVPLLQPFQGIFPTPTLEGRFTLEFSTLFALVVYALIGYFILEVLDSTMFLGRRKRRD